MDIADFIRDRVAEDHAAAIHATRGPWRYHPDKCWRHPDTGCAEEAVFTGPPGASAVCVAGTGPADDPQSMADARYIARTHPGRALVDVQTWLALLDAHKPRYGRRVTCSTCREPLDAQGNLHAAELWPCRTVKLLAARYRDHHDFNTAWEVE